MMNKMIDFCVQCVAALAFYAGDDEYQKKMKDLGWEGAFA